MFCTYFKLDMDIDVVICYVELVAIVFKFCIYELLHMDNDVNYNVKLVAITYLLCQYIVSKNAQKGQIHS